MHYTNAKPLMKTTFVQIQEMYITEPDYLVPHISKCNRQCIYLSIHICQLC